MELKTAIIRVSGIVQGVGFRPFIHRLAQRHSISGKVRNLSGSVLIEASGKPADLKAFYCAIPAEKPGPALISDISIQYQAKQRKYQGFVISASAPAKETKFIPPDIRACPQCMEEFNDKKNRRFHYPFINCTACGPRFTIIKDTPYDRRMTSMRGFRMCGSCAAEYGDISNRRYHAEPNACPVCGPKAWLADKDGNRIKLGNEAVFVEARRLLKKGRILAVKGLGGFHIAVDASNYAAIEELKRRKKRTNKPFAVMAPSPGAAKKFAVVSRYEESLLKSAAAPIVLLAKRKKFLLASNAAEGLAHIGVFLAYTPLHYMLFDRDLEALVMTSANIAEEPIQYDNREAARSLRPIVDYFIFHDREIVIPADDSVVKPYDGGRSVLIRRSRGFVPAPVFLKKGYPDIIAAGALLKNTACFIKGGLAIMSQHIGDLENNRAYGYFTSTISSFIKFYGLRPVAIACDSHPDYLSTRFAEAYAGKNKVPVVRVQHHYSHMLSCMAENKFYGKAVGIILDGTGYGSDGNTWGGEFLVGDFHSFERAAHLSYTKLPGGDIASREGYRTAISILSGFLGAKEIIRAYKNFPAYKILQLLEKNINSPLSSGAGRLFDAAASILGICHVSTYDAEAPMKLEAAAFGVKPSRSYGYRIKTTAKGRELDLAPCFEQLWRGRKDKKAAANFHFTLSSAAADMASLLAHETGIDNIVLSGGVFQNAVLLEMLLKRLKKSGFNVLIHQCLPPNDSSIALGQGVYAGEFLKNKYSV